MRGRAIAAAVGVTVVASALGLSGGTFAQAPPPRPLKLLAATRDPGWISFRVAGTPGASVVIAEQTGTTSSVVARLRLRYGSSGRHHAVAWRCDRIDRSFVATATNPGGGAETAMVTVRTPSCNGRLVASVWPEPARLGRAASVQIDDRWGIGGLALTVCATDPSGRRHCRRARLAPGAREVAARFLARRTGRWSVAVTGPGIGPIKRTLDVVRGHLTLLATGDSEIQLLDGMIASAVGGRMRFSSEAQISTGISKLSMFDWLSHARQQAQSLHPDVTVVYIGANDGFPIPDRSGRTVNCCGADWSRAYADRVAQMMGSYWRGGAGRVYWFTLPTPSRGDFARSFRAINAGFELAAARFAFGVHLMDIRPVFTPGDRYRSSMYWHGQLVNVREVDGTHLSVAGDRIALELLVAAMRRDGVLGG